MKRQKGEIAFVVIGVIVILGLAFFAWSTFKHTYAGNQPECVQQIVSSTSAAPSIPPACHEKGTELVANEANQLGQKAKPAPASTSAHK
ncbi:hypothetical protein [Dyella mobilis]|uniref:Uncharacterized protein n=1 Tax=Dyella mobilis TaxID=1849582 RepID=A0ABS2KIV2_9GAMM|nr:hypothetical protein [Dyella mobilis]MBM7131091.1 hypothetical protein [Dyella mobilis]GLQ97718.1 hypothetical protein GCM10007863_21380 [Dyella mobilis]